MLRVYHAWKTMMVGAERRGDEEGKEPEGQGEKQGGVDSRTVFKRS